MFVLIFVQSELPELVITHALIAAKVDNGTEQHVSQAAQKVNF